MKKTIVVYSSYAECDKAALLGNWIGNDSNVRVEVGLNDSEVRNLRNSGYNVIDSRH